MLIGSSTMVGSSKSGSLKKFTFVVPSSNCTERPLRDFLGPDVGCTAGPVCTVSVFLRFGSALVAGSPAGTLRDCVLFGWLLVMRKLVGMADKSNGAASFSSIPLFLAWFTRFMFLNSLGSLAESSMLSFRLLRFFRTLLAGTPALGRGRRGLAADPVLTAFSLNLSARVEEDGTGAGAVVAVVVIALAVLRATAGGGRGAVLLKALGFRAVPWYVVPAVDRPRSPAGRRAVDEEVADRQRGGDTFEVLLICGIPLNVVCLIALDASTSPTDPCSISFDSRASSLDSDSSSVDSAAILLAAEADEV